MPRGIYIHHTHQGYQKGHKTNLGKHWELSNETIKKHRKRWTSYLINGFKKGNKIGLGNKSRTGMLPWNKGIKYTKELCNKISEAHKGLKHSKEHIQKISNALKGHNVSDETRKKIGLANDKGKTSLHLRIRESKEYSNWRRDVFIRDRFTCQNCGITHTYIEAHHIKPFSKFPELRLDINNGLTLCEECHNKTKKEV